MSFWEANGIRSNVLHSFCSTNTSLLHLTSCQPWSFEYVELGQIWINAQRTWRANCANYGIINWRRGSSTVSRSAVLLCGLMGQWYKDIKSPRQGLERGEAWWPGCLWSRDQRRTTLRLSEHKRAGGNGEKEGGGAGNKDERWQQVREGYTKQMMILIWCLH